MSRRKKVLFALSGGIGFLVGLSAPILLIYPVFVVAVLLKLRFPKIKPPALRFLLATLSCCLFMESLAWLDNFIPNRADPALFHPQLIPDLLMGIGFYFGWWLAWVVLLRFFKFSLTDVFVVTGLYGVLIEQNGVVFQMGLASMPFGILLWLFVFFVYGSAMALAVYLVRGQFKGKRKSWMKYPLAWVGLFIGTYIGFLAWMVPLDSLKILPPKKFPMHDFPFW